MMAIPKKNTPVPVEWRPASCKNTELYQSIPSNQMRIIQISLGNLSLSPGNLYTEVSFWLDILVCKI
jgi:hypothetical protein